MDVVLRVLPGEEAEEEVDFCSGNENCCVSVKEEVVANIASDFDDTSPQCVKMADDTVSDNMCVNRAASGDSENQRLEPGEQSDSDSHVSNGFRRGSDSSITERDLEASQRCHDMQRLQPAEEIDSERFTNPGSRRDSDDSLGDVIGQRCRPDGDYARASLIADGIDGPSDGFTFKAAVERLFPGEEYPYDDDPPMDSSDTFLQSTLRSTSRLQPGEESEFDDSIASMACTSERLQPGEEMDWKCMIDCRINSALDVGLDRSPGTTSDCSDQQSAANIEKPVCKDCRGSGINYLGKVCECTASVKSPTKDASDEEGALEVDEAGFAAIQFARWAGCRWDRLHDLFNMDGRRMEASRGCSISEADFVEYLRRHGFHGDGPLIFRAILKSKVLGNKASQKESTRLELPQFLRFQRYASSLATPVSEDELQAFISLLKQQRGTLLRAWRLDLDRHCVGRVTFADLVHACRKLNLSGEARHVWIALRGSESVATPLRLADFAPEEAANLNDFTNVIWSKFGFDLSKAWSRIDVGGRGTATLEDFSRGVRSMGFEGNAKLIFCGIDASGKGRVRRQDMEYLKIFINPGREAYNALRDGDPEVQAFISWVQETMSGPELLLTSLGLSTSTSSPSKVLGNGHRQEYKIAGKQQHVAKLPVKDLAKRLQDLGYDGDALHVAVIAARATNGAQVSGDSLLSWFSGKRYSPSSDMSKELSPSSPLSIKSCGSNQSPSSARVIRKHASGWDNRTQTSDQGNEKSPYTRKYFSVPERGVPLRGAASFTTLVTPSSPPSTPSVTTPSTVQTVFTPRSRTSVQPEWNSSSQDFALMDKNRSRYTRTYFSKSETLSMAESDKARAPSPPTSARSSKRLTIVPSYLASPSSENLLSRSPRSCQPYSPRSVPLSESSRCYSARISVGPWKKSKGRYIGIPARTPGTPRIQPGSDFGGDSSDLESQSENDL